MIQQGTLLFISGGEITVILFIVVMVFGADKIPEIARGLGKGMRTLKDATNEAIGFLFGVPPERNPIETLNSIIKNLQGFNVLNTNKADLMDTINMVREVLQESFPQQPQRPHTIAPLLKRPSSPAYHQPILHHPARRLTLPPLSHIPSDPTAHNS